MNLRIGEVRNYNDRILISSPSFKIGTNLKINLDGEKDKPDIKPKLKTKPNIEPKQDVKPNIEFDKESKPNTHKITYEEEKVALVLGITTTFTLLWMFKWLPSPCLRQGICVYQDSNTCYERP